MNPTQKKYNPTLVLSLFLIVIFGLDILNKFGFSKIQPWSFFIKTGKSVFYIFFLYQVLVWSRDYIRKSAIFLFLAFFLAGQFLLNLNSGGQFWQNSFADISGNFRHFSLLLFPLVFIEYLSLNSTVNKGLQRVFITIIVLVVVSTFIGILTDLHLFRTYPVGSRSGYNGFLPKSITASYFYISALIFLYNLTVISNQKSYIILFLLTLFASIFVGTKAIYLFIILLAGFHFFYNKIYAKLSFYIGLLVICAVGFLFKNKIISQLDSFFHTLINLYNEKGLLTAIMSYRDEIFVNNFKHYSEHWNFLNYLIGGKLTDTKLFEISVVDLISFFGFIGATIYLYLYFSGLNRMKSINHSFFYFSILSVFLISLFAGQFFINISGISYFLLVIFMMNTKKNRKDSEV